MFTQMQLLPGAGSGPLVLGAEHLEVALFINILLDNEEIGLPSMCAWQVKRTNCCGCLVHMMFCWMRRNLGCAEPAVLQWFCWQRYSTVGGSGVQEQQQQHADAGSCVSTRSRAM